MAASRTTNPAMVVGPDDLAWLRQLESRATLTMSSDEGLQVRQVLRHSDAALAAPLPRSTSLSLGARSSADRMILLRAAMEVAADGKSPAVEGGRVATSSATYARRIRDEVLTWTSMRSWGSTAPIVTGQDSLLETAEVASTVALGYSLVPDAFSRAQRSTVRAALVSKALAPACWGYTNRSWMVESTSNWGVVVNAGMTMAAMVVADQNDAAAGAVFAQALPRLRRAVATTASDGGSPEGPNYTWLVHRYLALVSSSLLLSYGDAGGRQVPRVPAAAQHILDVTGPSGETFDYADADGAYIRPYLALWNARQGGDPLGDWLGQRLLDQRKVDGLLLLWARPETSKPTCQPLARTYESAGVAMLRSSWEEDATWVAVRGGSQVAGHRHLDLGTFVLEMDGRRFVDEYGQDEYSLPGYTGPLGSSSPWRLTTEAHSTLMRRSVQQPPTALAPLSSPTLGPSSRHITVDMRQALQAREASRQIVLAGEQVTTVDRVRLSSPAELRWSAHTRASVKLAREGRSALLTIDGRTVEARLGSSTPGAFRVVDAPAAPRGGRSNQGWRTLILDVGTRPARAGTHTAATVVTFVPR
ncbi:heparinase II/III domain-containing protein [Pseudokineococcus sp. 1T1Z-3]|uniref:heparinase II/III domain-containing protein n=1 Tax=Pseudokineococcus sp. 1T1Z-3 TaxID=3132745 RepID=UPI0030A765E6